MNSERINANSEQESSGSSAAETLSNMPSFEEHMENMKDPSTNKYGDYIDDDIDSSVYNIRALESSREQGVTVIDINSNKMTEMFKEANDQFKDTAKYKIEEGFFPFEEEKSFLLVEDNGDGEKITKVDINRFSRNDDGTYSRKSLVKIVPIEKGSEGAWSIGLFNKNEGNSKRYTGDIYGIAEIKEDGSLGEREIIDKGAITQYEKMTN